MDRAELERRGWVSDDDSETPMYRHPKCSAYDGHGWWADEAPAIVSYADACVAEALEKAAKAAEVELWGHATDLLREKTAAAIRALKPKETPHA